jgi:DNA primase catalytic subunit
MRETTQQRIRSDILELIKSHYRDNLIDLTSISALNFRHFRFRLPNGYFYKVKRKIRDSSDLREALIENEPLDVYYSVATWLNPHLLASKLDKDILKNVILSCDLAFDIDVNEEIESLEDARSQAVALNDFLGSKGILVRYNAFSGSKGFHVVCDDPWREEITEEDPRKREASAIERRKEIVQEAKERGLLFDGKVTIDTRRIIRVPGTVHSKTGVLCTLLSKEELESDVETIFKCIETKSFFAPRISQYLREMTAPSAYKISGFTGRLGVRPEPEPRICYSTFFTNNIPGTRLKIPVLEFSTWDNLEKVIAVIEEVQGKYGLGDILLFGDSTRYWAASLKAVPRRRIEKILFASGSLNLNQCKKYGCTYTRVGKSIGVEGEVVQDEPTFIKTLESDLRGQASRTHYEFFASLGIRFRRQHLDLCGAGKEKLELVHAIIE